MAIFARVAVGLFTLILLAVKAQWNIVIINSPELPHQDSGVASSSGTFSFLQNLANALSWHLLLPVACVIYFLCFRRFSTGK